MEMVNGKIRIFSIISCYNGSVHSNTSPNPFFIYLEISYPSEDQNFNMARHDRQTLYQKHSVEKEITSQELLCVLCSLNDDT